ncbi:DUF6777 domain-containing protein [Streptomyces sp. NPDC005322]|uniref:DUF6777 domain-containing protein n=1 Tax=Streptomyces sp. NPDC005322 TaxID=3157032 RepID=UPI0033B5B73C
MRSISWHLTSRRSVLAVGFVVAVAAVVVLGMISPSEKASGKAAGKGSVVEYHREPVGKTSVPAFTESVGHDQKRLVSPSNGGRTFLGNTPGLYAGAPNRHPCDRQALIHALQSDNKRGAAWSRVQHLPSPDAIPDYVHRLSGVVLRSDTYAKTYGYRGGVKPVPAVLQAGTAVFVNQRGAPVVKCDSGNPIRTSAPPRNAKTTFTGPEWNGFSRTTVTTIQPARKAVKGIVVVGVAKTQLFKRAIGDGNGEEDARETILARTDYPACLAMPGKQHAPDLPEAPKVKRTPSDRFTPLETERPSGTPSGQPQSQPSDPGQQPSDQPSDPNQQQPQPSDQPSDPNQQQQPQPSDQPSDPNQQQQPQPQPSDPNQQQPGQTQPPNQPPPNQPPQNQPPQNQPPPPQQPPPQQTQPDPNQQQPDPNQQQPPSGP